ncbi:MAG: restriction endonuclease subunit S [Bacilli bacterium]|nr:restriction endonuclease subunit S [Bacilli bacterium]
MSNDLDKNKKVPNVPNLRFGEYNDSWDFLIIKNYYETQMCKRIFANQTSQNESVPFYKIGTLGGIADSYISKELFKEYKSKYNFPKIGETLITCSGTVGKCIQFDGQDAYFQDSNIVWLRSENSPIINDFLFRLIDKKDWSQLNTTTISRIYTSDLLNLKFYYPSSKSEQEKIVLLLNKIDKRIETQNKIIKELNALRNSIMDNFYKKKTNGLYKSVSGMIDEFCMKTTRNSEYEVLSSTANGIYRQSEYFNKEAASSDTTGYKIIPFGYYTYRSMSDTGEFHFNQQMLIDKGIVSPAYPVFTIIEKHSKYVLLSLNNSPIVKKQILADKSGGTRFALPLSRLRKIQIPWADDKDISCFEELTSKIDTKLTLEKLIASKLLEQKNYLLANLFI